MKQLNIDKASLQALPNQLVIPTKDGLINIHNQIIQESIKTQSIGHYGVRDDSILDYLCDKLAIHKYKDDQLYNIYYIGTEVFFQIACRHPFTDANKRTAYIASLYIIGVNLLHLYGKTHSFYIKQENDGRIIETIAKWGEGSNVESLEKLIFQGKKPGKKKHDINEADVKQFINSFLRSKSYSQVKRMPTPLILMKKIMEAQRRTLEYLAKR